MLLLRIYAPFIKCMTDLAIQNPNIVCTSVTGKGVHKVQLQVKFLQLAKS